MDKKLEKTAKAMSHAIALRIEDENLQETAFKTAQGILKACHSTLKECEKAGVDFSISENIIAAALEAASLAWLM